MQAIHECRDAADDYSSQRRQLIAQYFMSTDHTHEPSTDNYNDDNDWVSAMQTPDDEPIDGAELDIEIFSAAKGRSLHDIILSVGAAQLGGFYETSVQVSFPEQFHGLGINIHSAVSLASYADAEYAEHAMRQLLREKEYYIDHHLQLVQDRYSQSAASQTHCGMIPEPILTTWQNEIEIAQQKLASISANVSHWNMLKPHQQLCLA
ncbi:hypothetical protein M422DRAFT_272289 [Sphaerobolus stellatus SS14]|uniref:Uncharacterized protein n=1 Tax=Sphaerobolus stellatus (strain SS14) TaxID=990650 RepID=A0A0C9TBR9_SPHS4|nr:hypothetical protein M422DRAFT_272289 [Sphaerobolus stellatus SS14]